MSINEAASRRRTLTKEQREQAERAIYGLPMNPMQSQISDNDIERMRAILREHDAQNNKGTIREFDLNNPPREPYVFQEFPKMLYKHGSRKTHIAHDAAEEERLLEAGWSNQPFSAEPQPEQLDPKDAAEVEALDRTARQPRKR